MDAEEKALNIAHIAVTIAKRDRKRDLKALEKSNQAVFDAAERYLRLVKQGPIDYTALNQAN